MSRVVIAVPFALLMVPAVSQVAPESPAKETEEIVVVSDTGGERQDAAQPQIEEVEKAIVEQTNAFRKKHGRTPVAANDELRKAAKNFAHYMAKTGRYGHTADGQQPAQRVKEAGYTFCIVRENIAYAFRTQGFSTEELTHEFVVGWQQSPGHRRNMLARWITGTGVAVAKSSETDTYFAVQVFGRPQSKAVTFEVVNQTEIAIPYRLGDRDYTIEPEVIRTHADCTPQQVDFLPLTQKGRASHPLHSVMATTSRSGDRMVITADEKSGYQVKVERNSASAIEVPPPAGS